MFNRRRRESPSKKSNAAAATSDVDNVLANDDDKGRRHQYRRVQAVVVSVRNALCSDGNERRQPSTPRRHRQRRQYVIRVRLALLLFSFCIVGYWLRTSRRRTHTSQIGRAHV